MDIKEMFTLISVYKTI